MDSVILSKIKKFKMLSLDNLINVTKTNCIGFIEPLNERRRQGLRAYPGCENKRQSRNCFPFRSKIINKCRDLPLLEGSIPNYESCCCAFNFIPVPIIDSLSSFATYITRF